jgi:hypothetical protein
MVGWVGGKMEAASAAKYGHWATDTGELDTTKREGGKKMAKEGENGFEGIGPKGHQSHKFRCRGGQKEGESGKEKQMGHHHHHHIDDKWKWKEWPYF